MLKVGGQWVSPVEVENTLMQHPAVLEGAVVAARDEAGLSRSKAFVILNEGYSASPKLVEDLKGFVKSRIAPYKYPRMIEFVEALPKTATGKIQRFRLRVEYVPRSTFHVPRSPFPFAAQNEFMTPAPSIAPEFTAFRRGRWRLL